MITVRYAKSWFGADKHATEPWDEKKARKKHEMGKEYTAILEVDGHPYCVVVVAKSKYIVVQFLDGFLREHLYYGFSMQECGRLFLSQATERSYVGDTDEVAGAIQYFFKTDGTVKVIESDLSTNIDEHSERQIDTTGNWESYPEFGDYASISRKDRGPVKHVPRK